MPSVSRLSGVGAADPVVYAGADRGDAYALVRRTLDLRHLEPHVYAEEEYAHGRETLERMVQDGITVYSIMGDR